MDAALPPHSAVRLCLTVAHLFFGLCGEAEPRRLIFVVTGRKAGGFPHCAAAMPH